MREVRWDSEYLYNFKNLSQITYYSLSSLFMESVFVISLTCTLRPSEQPGNDSTCGITLDHPLILKFVFFGLGAP